jgi:hypothetical protein
MSSVCSLDPRARETTLRALKELARSLHRDFAVDAVYVFGSFARGEEHEASDIDLLVVGDLPGRAFERIGIVLARTELPVEPIVISRSSLERRLAEQHPLFTRAMAEALPLD